MLEIWEIIKSVPFHFEVGDPSLFAWLTVVMYLIAAALCAACAWRADAIFQDAHTMKHRLIWIGLAAGLLFLGINKELDIQTWFTSVAKAIAWEQGWYEAGQRAQVLFILGMAVVAGGVFLFFAWSLRHIWRRYWLLGFGLLFIARFVITRAAGFYGVDLPELSQLTGGFKITWLLEFLGALVIAVAAYLNLRKAAPQPVAPVQQGSQA